MARGIDWESQLGRRIRLRDLHVLVTVARLGSMAKAARDLGVSQPAISQVVGNLEHTLGVKLLERSAQGVEPTAYGKAMLTRAIAAFYELRQGISDIEALTDPGTGDVRIGCPESIAAAFLQPVLFRFAEAHPRVTLSVDTINTLTFSAMLRERLVDLVLVRGGWPLDEPHLVEDFDVEAVFDDALLVAVGESHPLASRPEVDLTELAEEPWILTGADSWNYRVVAKAFRARGLPAPQVQMRTLSVHLRAEMAATGKYITTFPKSVLLLHAERLRLRALPVELPVQSWPIFAVTLKGRLISPATEQFFQCIRTVGRRLSEQATEDL